MEILSYTLKWSEAILRWGHVLFEILWVGNSFLFTSIIALILLAILIFVFKN